ncbi:MAG: metal ABC transporter substrate-binding protein [Verrucomicrobiota bacterium]
MYIFISNSYSRKRQFLLTIVLSFLLAVMTGTEVSGKSDGDSREQLSVVVTTTMLEVAVQDAFATAKSGELETRLLIPPGGCPGHFDLSPSFLPLLRNADLIIVHEFQDDLRKKITSLIGSDNRIITVSDRESLLIPENYLALVNEVQRKIGGLGNDFSSADDMLSASSKGIEREMQKLQQEAAELRDKCEGTGVIASALQAPFCRWLGFDIRGTMKRTENMTPKDLRQLLEVDAELVVANLQSGSQAGKTLSGRKGVPLVILSNFPKASGYGSDYPTLFRQNLKKLEEACQTQSR